METTGFLEIASKFFGLDAYDDDWTSEEEEEFRVMKVAKSVLENFLGYPALKDYEEFYPDSTSLADRAINTCKYASDIRKTGIIHFIQEELRRPGSESYYPYKKFSVAHKPVVHAICDPNWRHFWGKKGIKTSGGRELNLLGDHGIGENTPLTLDNPDLHSKIKKVLTKGNFSLEFIAFNTPSIYRVVDQYFNHKLCTEGTSLVTNISDDIIQTVNRMNLTVLLAPDHSKCSPYFYDLLFNPDGSPNEEWNKVPRAVEELGQVISDAILCDPSYFFREGYKMILRILSTLIDIEKLPEFSFQTHTNIFQEAVTTIYELSDSARHEKSEPVIFKDKPIKGQIEMMLDRQEEFSKEEIEDIIKLILVVGQRTTSVTLVSAIKHLLDHPEWQEILYDEIMETLGDSEVTHEKINGMEKLHHFVWEVLRLNAPVPLQTRDAYKDLEFDGIKVKKGEFMAFPHYLVQRDETRYEDPLRFNPDRYTKGREGCPVVKRATEYSVKRFNPDLDKKMVMKTFGGGSHQCCGKHLALTATIKCFLIKVLRTFQIEEADRNEPENKEHLGGFVLKYKGDLYVRLVHRN